MRLEAGQFVQRLTNTFMPQRGKQMRPEWPLVLARTNSVVWRPPFAWSPWGTRYDGIHTERCENVALCIENLNARLYLQLDASVDARPGVTIVSVGARAFKRVTIAFDYSSTMFSASDMSKNSCIPNIEKGSDVTKTVLVDKEGRDYDGASRPVTPRNDLVRLLVSGRKRRGSTTPVSLGGREAERTLRLTDIDLPSVGSK